MIYSWVRQVLINIFIKNIQISLTGSLEYYSCWKKDFLNHFQAQDILLSSLMNPTTRTALFFHPSATSKYKQKILFQIQTKYIDQQLEQVDDILWPQNVSKIFGVSTFMFLALGLKIQRRNLDRKHFKAGQRSGFHLARFRSKSFFFWWAQHKGRGPKK